MKGWTERDCPAFVAGVAAVFTARHRQGACKWMLEGGVDGGGSRDVAMEYDSELAVHRLLVTAPLLRRTLDALVVLWCCHVWHRSSVPTLFSSSAPWKRFR